MKNFNETPTPCCANLRCKSMFYQPDERPGLLHVEEAMGYWCALTNDALGPDDCLAAHGRCQPGRDCYKAAPQRRTAAGT